MQIDRNDGNIHKEDCLSQSNYEGSEEIEKIYELARAGGKNFTLAKELEKQYLMECSINENYEIMKLKNKNENDSHVAGVEIERMECHLPETTDMNYLPRLFIL